MDKNELIKVIQDLAKELGRAPLFREFDNHLVGAQNKLRKHFGTFNNLLAAAKIEKTKIRIRSEHTIFEADKLERKFEKTYKAICGKREQIQGFFRTVLDLKELFDRAGNPSSLKVFWIPDVHSKFVDQITFNCAMKFLAYWGPDVLGIIGDFIDCEGLSHWPSSDLEPRRIVPEMKQGRELLQRIQNATIKCTTRIFLEGNHERWILSAMSKMPEMFDGLAELDIEINVKTLLSLDKFGYAFYPLNEIIQIGKAHWSHGMYIPQHHAKKHLDVLKCNFYYGHTHDDQNHNQTSIDGPMEASSLGTWARKDAKFLRGLPNNWVHSMPCFEFFPDGSYTFYKPKIENGKMSFNGIVFDGNI